MALFRRNDTRPSLAARRRRRPVSPGTKKAGPRRPARRPRPRDGSGSPRTYRKKEARKDAARQARAERMRAVNAREDVPEKALMRDYVDSRFNLGEFLLPAWLSSWH